MPTPHACSPLSPPPRCWWRSPRLRPPPPFAAELNCTGNDTNGGGPQLAATGDNPLLGPGLIATLLVVSGVVAWITATRRSRRR